MTPDPNYYELLGVDTKASVTDIKGAFRRQALRNHPDQGGNPAVFRIIEQAYETLVSPTKRHEYDSWLFASGEGTPPGGVHIPRDEQGNAWPGTEYATNFENREPVEEEDKSSEQETWKQPTATFVKAEPNRSTAKRRVAGFFFDRGPIWVIQRFVVVLIIVLALSIYMGRLPLSSVFDFGMIFWVWVVVVIAWALLPLVLRIGGIVVMVFALIDANGDNIPKPEALLHFVAGFGLWLLGQWLYTFTRGAWNSAIAETLFRRLPGVLRPDWRHRSLT